MELNQSNFEALQQRTAKLERRLKLINLFWILIFGVLFTSAWSMNKYSGEVIDNLRVRLITVLDEKGTERMYIGSPVPGPMTNGKRVPRVSPATGIIINDLAGNERSGWGFLDNGRQNLCFDGEGGAEIVPLLVELRKEYNLGNMVYPKKNYSRSNCNKCERQGS
jgi:hypothetical protein